MNQSITIILADDDSGHRSLMKRNLGRSNVANQIVEFCDGQEVLDYFKKRKADGSLNPDGYLVLLDIRMPKIDGVSVLRQLKADPALRKIPVIMVTTTDDPLEVDRCHELGCSHYVAKPVEYEEFINAVRNLGLFISIVKVPRLG